MKRVTRSFPKHSLRPLAASLVLGLVACAGADDADETPEFDPPPFAGSGQGAPAPGVGAGTSGNGATG
ncbi:MAG TPA: hypothetical protein VMG12_02920, partial [Polyangiaceae bacterium]|nr:hypothetical protein [Polyangiaceae bacterium]